MSNREGYLHDYLVASFIGLGFGMAMGSITLGAIGNWGVFIAMTIMVGLFGFIPAGLTASYVNFRFHLMSENKKMAGLSAGLFTAFVYTVVGLMMAIVEAIANTGAAAAIFIAWIIGVVFAFIFMALGGYIEGMFEDRPFAMIGFFNMEKVQRMPPPPPTGNAQMCPTCGRPMKFVEQYNRWYCDYDKKYL
ncbi:MAG: hypothetical protein ACE14S_01215 [Candidatus Bathyarchaeia archaeon]